MDLIERTEVVEGLLEPHIDQVVVTTVVIYDDVEQEEVAEICVDAPTNAGTVTGRLQYRYNNGWEFVKATEVRWYPPHLDDSTEWAREYVPSSRVLSLTGVEEVASGHLHLIDTLRKAVQQAAMNSLLG